jgi:hypothetical protein
MNQRIIWIAFVILFLLHHDFWLWNDKSLLLGFLPVGLAWHMGYSVAAAILWALATRFAWPSAWERWAESGPESEE